MSGFCNQRTYTVAMLYKQISMYACICILTYILYMYIGKLMLRNRTYINWDELHYKVVTRDCISLQSVDTLHELLLSRI